jgi:DNA replication licensing factor MCM5
MDAAQSGITANLIVSPEMRAEIQQVELQVKRRMGIGNFLSERHLIDELMRTGLSESTVRRALIVMSQLGEIEYKRERRVILRKS